MRSSCWSCATRSRCGAGRRPGRGSGRPIGGGECRDGGRDARLQRRCRSAMASAAMAADAPDDWRTSAPTQLNAALAAEAADRPCPSLW